MRTRVVAAMLFIVASSFSSARAQRPEDVAAAGAAFREGQTAQLAGDYARAAELFELADATAPSAAALRSAIRNRQAAGHAARAASLAADALARYPDDAETRTLAEGVLAELGPTLGEVHVRCADPCSISLDGRAVHDHAETSFDVYVDPGPHTLVASWVGRETVTRSLDAVAGSDSSFELATPAAVVVEPDPEPEPEPTPVTPPGGGGGGVSPVLFGVGAGLTVVSGAILVWSGLDVLSARDAYVAVPTEAGYRDGLDRETRTNVLVGVTSGLALATVIVAIVTDWDGDPPATTEASLRPTIELPEGGVVFGVSGAM